MFAGVAAVPSILERFTGSALVLALIGFFAADVSTAAGGSPVQPNIVVIMLDDAGFADFGVNGSGFIQTPVIDALTAAGTKFTQYYANAPVCAPTRTSIVTGRYPVTLGMRANGSSRIDLDVETLPRILKDAGYLTAHVGKWHLNSATEDYYPLVAGFDYDVRYKSSLAASSSYFDPTITIDNSQTVEHVGEHLTEVLTDYAIGFLTDNAGTAPLFLQLWHWAPHRPLEPPLDWAALYPDTEEGKVGAMISDVDEQVGRLLDTLDTLGIADDTLVIITSDNGGEKTTHFNDPADGPSNAPYKGGKNTFTEGGIRVPFFARWPNGPIPAGSVNESPVASMDMIPTFAELAGADVSGLDLAGTSMVSSLLGTWVPRAEPMFWELKAFGHYFVYTDQILDDFAVRDGDWKLVRQDGVFNLYDLAADESEVDDLAASNPTLVEDLLALNQAWRLESGAIEYGVGTVYGDVIVDGDDWTFSGGRLELTDHAYMNVLDLDFSLLARVTPTSAPVTNRQLIAGKHGSWRLAWLGNQRIMLEVTGSDGVRSTIRSQPLVVGQTYDLAFTVFYWKNDPSTVRLYLDGVLQGETNEITAVKSSSQPINLGNTANLSQPFLGVIDYLDLYSVALRPYEMDDLFAAAASP